MMTPCVLCHLDFDLDLSDDDEVQVIKMIITPVSISSVILLLQFEKVDAC